MKYKGVVVAFTEQPNWFISYEELPIYSPYSSHRSGNL